MVPSREPVWCLTSKLPLRDSKGTIIGLIGFSRDVRISLDAKEIPIEFANAFAEFEQDLSSDFSPSILAERSRLSSPRLARLTKRLFSLTPSQLISKARITAASRLLRDTEYTVAEIANRCGYFDQSAFARAFRSLTVPHLWSFAGRNVSFETKHKTTETAYIHLHRLLEYDFPRIKRRHKFSISSVSRLFN